MFAISVGTYLFFSDGRLYQTPGGKTLIHQVSPFCFTTREENSVTYYRVDFVAAKLISRPAKRFVSEEKARQHARRVLGVPDDSGLFSKVAIVPVSKGGTRV